MAAHPAGEKAPIASPGPRTIDPSGLEGVLAERVGSVREARWIVEHVKGDAELALVLADRRAAGEPLQYVLGRWPFRTLDLVVDPRVLIPRPETEQLVEAALGELGDGVSVASSDGHRSTSGPVCVDLGTGSGAIALALAVEGGPEAPGLVVWATDDSPAALAVAAENRNWLSRRDPVAAGRVRLAEARWFEALPAEVAGTVDLVVSNPPYVSEADFLRLDPTVRDWEPRSALVAAEAGGVGGMADIEAIVAEAPHWLHPGGVAVIEIDPAQAVASLEAARRAGFGRSHTRCDLAGRVRMLVARR